MDEAEAKKRLTEVLERAQGARKQRGFARDLGVQQNSLGQWLRGSTFPALDKFPAISRSSGKPVSAVVNYVLYGQEEYCELEKPICAEDVFNYGRNLETKEIVILICLLTELLDEKPPSYTKVVKD